MMRLVESYNCVAAEYARAYRNELLHKALDRRVLHRFARRIRYGGLVCDAGCGPGQIARFLQTQGVNIIGLDISTAMVNQAQLHHPEIQFVAGDMIALPFANQAISGIVAFYSIIHTPGHRVADVLLEFKRVLKPEGLVLLAFHAGDEVIHLDEWWQQSVSLDFYFFTRDAMTCFFENVGFIVEEVFERDPYLRVEYPSRRGYMIARKTPR